MTDISSLKAALLRAERTGHVDGQEDKTLLVMKLSREVIDLIDKYALPTNLDGLSTLEIERTLIGLVGCIVKSATKNKINAVIIASALAKELLYAATED